MTAKLVFSVPGVERGEQIVQILRQNGVDESSISVIGKEASAHAEIADPGEFENDAVPAAKRGALFGGATGLLAGLGAIVVAPGLVLGGAAVALTTAGGATFGVIASSIIGSSVPNSQLREYEEAIARGELLLVVEIEEQERSRLTALLHAEFPELELEGEVDSIPPVV